MGLNLYAGNPGEGSFVIDGVLLQIMGIMLPWFVLQPCMVNQTAPLRYLAAGKRQSPPAVSLSPTAGYCLERGWSWGGGGFVHFSCIVLMNVENTQKMKNHTK